MSVKVEDNLVVTFVFSMKDDSGEVNEESDKPLVALQGHKNILPGLEQAVYGMQINDKKTIVLPPEQAYGHTDDRLLKKLPKSVFPENEDLLKGVDYQAQTPDGPIIFTIKEIYENEVLIDGNHPLAGKTLTFEVEIQDIRPATEEELKEGRPLENQQ